MHEKTARFLPLYLAALIGTNAQPQAPSAPQPSASEPTRKAVVYVFRQGSVVGAAGYDLVFVNNEYLAALRNSNYAKCEVPPGPVIFATAGRMHKAIVGWSTLLSLQKKARERLRIEVEGGKTYYIRWSVGSKMRVVDASEGERQMPRLRPAEH